MEKEPEKKTANYKKEQYKKQSIKYQEWSFYCLVFLSVLAAVLFLRELFPF